MTWRRIQASVWPCLDRPIFIIGSPRSGTTFLGSCIAELGRVSYHHEPIATKAMARNVYSGAWGESRARFFYKAVYRWLLRIHVDGDLRFAEKTPRNCFLIPFLSRAFPEAQFIHIMRDGRDAALSHSKKPWLQVASADSGKREPGGYRYGPYPRFWVEKHRLEEFERTTDLHRCIWAWRRHVESALSAIAVLPPVRHHTVRYEELVARPATEAEKLLDFLHISEPASRSRFQESVANIHARSVGRWKEELSDEELSTIEHEAGVLLRTLGYA